MIISNIYQKEINVNEVKLNYRQRPKGKMIKDQRFII